MAEDLVVQDSDDRCERMVRDPKRYFDEARRKAEREVRREAELRPNRSERSGHG